MKQQRQRQRQQCRRRRCLTSSSPKLTAAAAAAAVAAGATRAEQAGHNNVHDLISTVLAQSPEYPESKNTSNKSPEHREFKNTTLAIAWVPAVSRPNSAHKFENDALLEAQWPRQMQRRALWLYRLLVLDKLQAHHEAKVLRVANGLRSDALK